MSIDVDRLRSEIDVDPSKAIAGLNAFDGALTAVSRDRSSDLDVDFTGAQELPRIEALMDVIARDRHVNIDVDAGGLDSAARSLGNVSSAATTAGSALADAAGNGGKMGGVFAGIASGAAGAAGALVGVAQAFGPMIAGAIVIGSILPGAFAAAAAGAGILMAALVPLVGLLGALPVMLGGLGLVGGALIGGLAGVVGGVSAYKEATTGAAGATADLTGQQNALISAQQGLASAIHGVTKAQQGLKDAQEDLAKAPLEAAEAIEDAHFRREQAIISEKRAILALQAAQKNLSDAQNESARSSLKVTQQTDEFTGKMYDVAVATDDAVSKAAEQKQALLDVQQAELDVKTARDENGDSQRHLTEMEKKGIKNSDIMVAARRRVADAEWSLKQAHQGVANAQRAVAQAQKNLTAGAGAASAATTAWADAQKKLSDEGVEFVKFMADDFLPALSGVGKAIQTEMLPGLQGGLTIMMDEFDVIGQELGLIGGLIGDTFEEFMQFWTMPKQRSILTEMFDNLNDTVEAGLGLLRPFSRVLAHITEAAAPMVTGILDTLGDKLDGLADKWEKPGGKKGLDQFFEDAAYFGGLWMDVLEGIWAVLEPIVNAGKPLAAKWLKGMAEELQEMGDYLASPAGQDMLTQFFEDAVPALKETWEFITGIADALFNSSKGGEDSGFFKFMKTLNDDIVPSLKDFLESVDTSDIASDLTELGDNLIQLATDINDSGIIGLLGGLADAIGALIDLGQFVMPASPMDDQGIAEAAEKDRGRFETIWGGIDSWWVENVETPLRTSVFGMEEGETGFKGIWSRITESFKSDWREATATMSEEWAIWRGGFDTAGTLISQTWTDVTDGMKRGWSRMITAVTEFDWENFLDTHIANLNWGGIWDGMVDAFYWAMEMVATAWNATLGGLSIEIPGLGKIEIPNIDAPSAPTSSGPATGRGGSQPLLSGGSASTDGSGAQEDFAGGDSRIQINQTFNTPVDPDHVARALGWELAV